MKPVSALLVNVAVVAAGIFVYHTWIRPPTAADDFLSDRALARLEEQMGEITRRRGGTSGNTRVMRIGDAVRQLKLGLSPEDEGRLVKVCEDFQQNRIRFWSDPATRAMDEPTYEHAYRAFVERHLLEIREVVKDPQQQENIIRRFIWDGRIIRRNVNPDTR